MNGRTRSGATRSRNGVSVGAAGVKGTPGVRKSSRLQQAQRKQSPTSSGRRVLKNASPATAESAGNGRPSSVQPLGEQQPNRRRQNSVAKPGPHALGSAGNTAPPDATRTGRDAQSTDIVGVAAGSGGGSCNQSKSSLQAAGATAADQPAAALLRDVPSALRGLRVSWPSPACQVDKRRRVFRLWRLPPLATLATPINKPSEHNLRCQPACQAHGRADVRCSRQV